jgi:hypothetical protein
MEDRSLVYNALCAEECISFRLCRSVSGMPGVPWIHERQYTGILRVAFCIM